MILTIQSITATVREISILSVYGKKPSLIFKALYHFSLFPAYFSGKKTKTEAKERFYGFLKSVPDAEAMLSEFWDKNIKKIKKWYLEQQKEDDVIISASPEFIVAPACKRLGIKYVMASCVDIKTGKYNGVNCHGEEKVRRFYEAFPDGVIDEFYSDSLNDTPLSRIAKKAFFVKNNKLENWE